MKVVTTVHKAGFEQYGHRWIESVRHWPKADFVMYAEGFEPDFPHKRCEEVERLEAFKAKHADYIAPSWRYDIKRFSNKVFAAYDALYDHDGIGVWLDADCVTFKDIPDGFIEGLLDGAYLAHFDRPGHYTETGLWVMDCRHPEHKAFLDTWVDWFESGAFKQLHEWHDCTTLDATIRMFKRDGRIKTKSLSGEHGKGMHPMAKAATSQYIDHCKGPRKNLGFSPENEWRKP